MTPPTDGTGPLGTVTVTVLVIAVLFFAYFVLDGVRRLPRVRETFADARSLTPAYLLGGGAAAVMALALALAYASSRYENALDELALDAYDVWLGLEHAGQPLPSGPPPGGQVPGGLVVAAVVAVVVALVLLALYLAHGFGRAATLRRAFWWGAALVVGVALLIGLAALAMWHDVGVHEQAWESWLGEEVR
ncbi:hypothetical protein GCM10009809_09900 [Isoptericola hypogeus]|uniref:Uncharacterized protein n=1 Tax=Isoptericola hypogeus TaxID=300179 RepID=A0ABN2J0Y1_9MICO